MHFLAVPLAPRDETNDLQDRDAGNIKAKAVIEVVQWMEGNRTQLEAVWKEEVHERTPKFLTLDEIQVASRLLEKPQSLIAQPGGSQVLWQPELRLSSALLSNPFEQPFD